MPYDVVPRNKSWGKREKRGMFGVMVFASLSSFYMWWSHAFLEMVEYVPADGK